MQLDVSIVFETEISELDAYADSDLIVAADGVNSTIRTARSEAFGTTVGFGRNYFCWLGSTRELDAFKYFFRMTEYGPIVMHSYQYEPGMSTWVCEMEPETIEKAGFLQKSEERCIAELTELFAEDLEGLLGRDPPSAL
jgi:anthraniloyl-CoA monooxygenase